MPRATADVAAWRARCLIVAAVDDAHAARLTAVAPSLMGVPSETFTAAVAAVARAATRADAWRVALAYNDEWQAAT